MGVIDEYLANVPEKERAELERVRSIIQLTAPEASEVISYGMPGFKYDGKYLITFAAFKDHLSIFPGSEAIEAFSEDLKNFKTSKGTVQFTLDKTIPEPTLKKIILFRVADITKR